MVGVYVVSLGPFGSVGTIWTSLGKSRGPVGLGTIWIYLGESRGPDGRTIWVTLKRDADQLDWGPFGYLLVRAKDQMDGLFGSFSKELEDHLERLFGWDYMKLSRSLNQPLLPILCILVSSFYLLHSLSGGVIQN